MADDSGRTPRRNNPAQARAKLLDAAERLFSVHGLHAVSVRDIVAEAGLKLSMLPYHFGSKDELFSEVIGRRSAEYVGRTKASLEAAITAANGKPPAAEAIVRAYLKPSFELSMYGGEGWKNYIQLITRSMSIPENEAMLARFWVDLEPVQKSTIAAFAAVRPDADIEDLNWAVYFLICSTVQVLVESGLVDRQSDGLCQSSNLERILEKMVPYFAAGFERLVGKPK